MSTITRDDVSAIGQTIDRALRHLRHSRQLSAARRSGDMAAQLEHSLHVADCEIGMAKSPAVADHWRGIHAEVRELIAEAGFQWRGGRLVNPSRPAAKSLAKSFASPARAAQYNELRSEVMQSMAKARADRDLESRQQLITLRDQLTAQAAKEGLRLDSGFRFVPARA